MKLKTVLILIAGILLGAFGNFVWHLAVEFAFPRPSEVCVVNHTGSVLEEVTVDVSPNVHQIGSLAPGARTAVVVNPPDSRLAVVRFKIEGRRREVDCGAIGRKREARTVTVIQNGENVIVDYGSTQAVNSLTPTTVAR